MFGYFAASCPLSSLDKGTRLSVHDALQTRSTGREIIGHGGNRCAFAYFPTALAAKYGTSPLSEQKVLSFVDLGGEKIRSAAIGVELLHQPSMGCPYFVLAGPGLQSENRPGLLRRHSDRGRSGLARLARAGAMRTPIGTMVAIEIRLEDCGRIGIFGPAGQEQIDDLILAKLAEPAAAEPSLEHHTVD